MTVAYAALFGLAFGSFVNAAMERIPRGESLMGRSHCDGCTRALHAWELIPVLSYVVLRGRCASCSRSIGMRTPAVELGCALSFAAAFALLPVLAAAAASMSVVAIAVAAGVTLERRSLGS